MAYERKTILNQQNPSPKHKKLSNQRNWSNFPSELLELILTKLSFRNKFRFQRVCSFWLVAGKTHFSSLYRKYQSQSPLLMLSSSHVLDDSFLCNFEEKLLEHVATFPKQFVKKECIGSSNGWLVFFDKRYSLFNPFLDAHVKIYHLSELENTTKVVLWSDPIFGDNNNYAIVAIYRDDDDDDDDNHSYIKYARCGDNSWTDLDKSFETSYDDIICRNDKIYALTKSCSVEAWNFKTSIPSKVMFIHPSLPRETIEFRETLDQELYISQFYLIGSQNELFLVTRDIGYIVCDHGLVLYEVDMMDYEHRHCEFSYRTVLFHVFKLDFDKIEWVPVGHLGDQLIFLGGNHSVMVKAQYAKEYHKNSIYFTDDSWQLMRLDIGNGGHDVGIYNLEDRSIKELFTSAEVKPPPFWVIPRLP